MDINSAYSDIEVFLAYFWKIYFLNTTLLYIIEFGIKYALSFATKTFQNFQNWKRRVGFRKI